MHLEVYGHGGDLKTASARYGIPVEQFTDFSANINPLGPPPGLQEVLVEALSGIGSYPDPGHRGVIRMLSDQLGLNDDMLLIGNGAAENMALCLLALRPQTVGIIEPCFSEYRALSESFGAKVKSIYGTEENAFKAGCPEEVEQLIKTCDMVFIGQPNNPNGVQYSIDELRSFAAAGEQFDTYIVLDEAFIDFIPEHDRHSLLPEILQYPHLIVIRSMTKFYAIPGLRLGYSIAHRNITRAMRDKQVTWSVNSLALRAGEFCLEAGEDFAKRTIQAVSEQRAVLMNGLAELGCKTWLGEANFLLVRLPEPWSAAGVQTNLAERGILIRSCAMYPGLGERDIRIAVKGPEACSRLLIEMKQMMGAGRNEGTDAFSK